MNDETTKGRALTDRLNDTIQQSTAIIAQELPNNVHAVAEENGMMETGQAHADRTGEIAFVSKGSQRSKRRTMLHMLREESSQMRAVRLRTPHRG